MTILIGVRCHDGVVVGTDSASTFAAGGQIRTIEQPTKKVFVIEDRVIVAGTGEVGLTQRFVAVAQAAHTQQVFRQPAIEIGKALAREAITDFNSTGLKGPFRFGALVAFPCGQRAELCEFAEGTMQPELKNDVWYVAMGGGQIIVLALVACVLMLLPLLARGQIPAAAERWKHQVLQQTRAEWGLDAPTATFGAQLETESGFREDAHSPAGALGIAQFTPATAAWLAGAYEALGPADPLNPAWALRALARYDRYLWERVAAAADNCERWGMTLSGYNGGERLRDRARALCVGTCDAARWFGNVELVDDGRTLAAWTENRRYPMTILLMREPDYIAAAWGDGACSRP